MLLPPYGLPYESPHSSSKQVILASTHLNFECFSTLK